jgi:hypothetical protein
LAIKPRPWEPPWDGSTREGRVEYMQKVVQLQALARGEATDIQQVEILEYLITAVCATYDLSFRPDEMGGQRASDFAEGKRFIGLQLVAMLKLKPSSLVEGDDYKTSEQG